LINSILWSTFKNCRLRYSPPINFIIGLLQWHLQLFIPGLSINEDFEWRKNFITKIIICHIQATTPGIISMAGTLTGWDLEKKKVKMNMEVTALLFSSQAVSLAAIKKVMNNM